MTDIELVTELYAAFDRGELASVQHHIAEDFVLDQPEHLPWSGRYYGPNGFLAFFATLAEHIDTRIETEQIFDAGGTIVQLGYTVGTVRANGAAFRSREVHLLTVRDRQLLRYRAFVEVPVMLAALGAGVGR
ncbi:MAG TPA: nuclear transport factor 2 family protein [Pseudonocardia sp.]|nr:nuclear transport factor 2 family protein [Pseudonocardia sp.]